MQPYGSKYRNLIPPLVFYAKSLAKDILSGTDCRHCLFLRGFSTIRICVRTAILASDFAV